MQSIRENEAKPLVGSAAGHAGHQHHALALVNLAEVL